MEEVRISERSGGRTGLTVVPGLAGRPTPITAVESQHQSRVSTGIGELDRVLGGGIVPGALILVGGDPGIGKSTLLTQVAHHMTAGAVESGTDGQLGKDLPKTSLNVPSLQYSSTPPLRAVLYVSGEESIQQIRLRSERLGAQAERFLVVNETDVSAILHHIDNVKPDLVVVDSIQTTYDTSLESAPGTVSQVRNCAAALTRIAKSGGPPIVLIGHVTKEGSLAGPRVLEHMVDTVLYFEGDRQHAYRILRAVKNRFGSTDEIGIFEMREDGLAEVENPSAALLAERTSGTSGSAVAATMEGSRSLLVEVQALVSRSFLANPRRSSTGIDLNRLNMLLAVLEKRVGLKLGDQDVFVNVAGGVRIIEPAADLAVCLSVISNFREQPVEPATILIGEVGLGGELRAVPQTEKRLREAARLGFKNAVTARHQSDRLPANLGIKVTCAATVLEAMNTALLRTAK